ncbi:hypothetical protein KPL74_15005 [Bacillus sp. NP157]|nr:hypothetical protein KPL74_15005 [Bacillus sp. NP157]
MYYETSNGVDRHSWGFAPIEHGSVYGMGEPQKDDANQYVDPMYERTMEISRDQYEKLNAFGEDPSRYGFDLMYKDIRNNCVDYTWAALNHAGIQRTHGHLGHLEQHGVDGKLSYLPILAPNDFRTIPDPVPGSDLNNEVTRDPPAREWSQAPFGSFQREAAVSHDDPFERLYAATAANDDKSMNEVAQDYLQSTEGQDFLESGRDFNRQQELALQQSMEQAQQQAQQQAPVMSMSM